MKGWWALTGLMLLLAVLAWSSALVVERAHEQRALYGKLQAVQARQDALLTEQSRLLLERGAIAAYQNVERVAEHDLKMRFPAQVEFVSR